MLEASNDALAVALDHLEEIYNELDKDQILQDRKRYRRHVRATDTNTEVVSRWTTQELVQFIIKWD